MIFIFIAFSIIMIKSINLHHIILFFILNHVINRNIVAFSIILFILGYLVLFDCSILRITLGFSFLHFFSFPIFFFIDHHYVIIIILCILKALKLIFSILCICKLFKYLKNLSIYSKTLFLELWTFIKQCFQNFKNLKTSNIQECPYLLYIVLWICHNSCISFCCQ